VEPRINIKEDNMRDRLKTVLKTTNNEEGGYILVSVIILMLLIALMIPPFLGFMATGAKSGTVYESKTNELYAANSGIEDAKWKIKYDYLNATFPDYNPYDYFSSWSYDLSEEVNGYTVNATIQNYWIPKDLTPPSESDSARIIEGVGSHPPKVIITGNVTAASTYQIKIQYYPNTGENLKIDTIGVWLPTGCTYVEGSGSLEAQPYGITPVVEPWDGGQAITWNCGSYPFAGYDSNGDGDYNDFGELSPFPNVNRGDTPMVSTLTFQFSGPSGRTPEAISWVNTNLDLTQGGTKITTYTWDTDMKVYKVTSVAGGTEVETYIPKSEIREIGSPISGDYKAIGNSLMARSSSTIKYRDILLSETSATVGDIPSDAYVAIAYLYWSGWFEGQTNLVADTTAIFKINGQQVYFDTQGKPQQGSHEIIADPADPGDRVQVINNSNYGNPHGYSYSCRKDVTDLVRKYSDSGNATYTVGSVGATWNVKDEWAYAGWSLVIIYSSADTEGHQLYLYDDFLYKDHDGKYLDFDQDGKEGGIIDGFIVPKPVSGEVNAARITAFVGEGDVWYTGDYLQFNGSKLNDGTGGGVNNVWNGASLGMSAEGIDVDTFYIPWSSGLLEPGDTAAEINIWTENDIWNLAYIILSFRTESTTGGCLGYLVH
jgi:hypothetical protein